jgi:transcriptional regulator with XRE-family HTH domain
MEEVLDLRKILSLNLKKHREILGISQEKLAEYASLSTMMVKDIEGCRTWVSEKTLVRLATALKTDVYRLLMPDTPIIDEISRAVLVDLVNISQKIKKDIATDLENTLKLWGLNKKP